MTACPNCGHQMVRVHRTLLQKALFSESLRCSKCAFRRRSLYGPLYVNLAFLSSRNTCCVRCGNSRVHALSTRDRLERMSRHPISQLFRLTGAPLRFCPLCRLQYYDWRPIAPRRHAVPEDRGIAV